jgi:hypothetical protein
MNHTNSDLGEPILPVNGLGHRPTESNVLYTPVSLAEESTSLILPRDEQVRSTVMNFTFMAILFSANHGCTVACLSLATARLGSLGAWQSGTLYLTYTASAVLGATYVTKKLGGRNAMIGGMTLCEICNTYVLVNVSNSW